MASLENVLLRRRCCPIPSEYEAPESEPELFFADDRLVEFRVTLPSGTKIVKDAAERMLINLTYASSPIAFEVVGTSDGIVTQFACLEPDRVPLAQQLLAHFPEAIITEHDKFLVGLWDDNKASVIVDFGLSRECMLPIRTFHSFDIDPLIGIVGALANVREGELGVLQLLFQATRHPWAESMLRAVTDGEGHSFLADAPEMVSLAREKVAQPLFAAVLRVAVCSPTQARAWTIAKALSGALRQFASPTGNEFIPLTNDGYEDQDHAEDLCARRSRRSGMLLNVDELASLAHLPSASVRVPQLKREEGKTKAAPEIVKGHAFTLGENTYSGHTVTVGLSADQRTQHCYLIGASGTGKSTLLLNMILQDIEHGDGLAVLDPHGDLIDEILGRIPEKRAEDVVLIDPSDEAYPVGFNVLHAHSEIEKNLLGSDLVAVFRRLSTSWGDQMTSVLGNAVLAFLESTEGGSLVDLRRFLVDGGFRATFLKTVRDPEVVYYWERTFPLLVGKQPQGPILTRLDTFLRPKLIRYMVAQRENRFDLADIMNEGKIFLAKLAQGAIGEENAYLLGTLLVSKFQQLAMSRQQTAAALRRNFYLYIDEFHNFVTPTMAAILSGARKYRLGLVLAHQELQQLTSRDADVASAVSANPYTRICFRLGDYDAKKLADGFSFFQAKDLQNLQVGEAICRVERAEFDFNLKTRPLPVVDREEARKRREQLVEYSRRHYARPRADVEAALIPTDMPPTKASVSPPEKRKKEAPLPVAAKAEAKEPPPDIEQIPGRGGPQHKYLQDLIRRWAEDRGYTVTLEKPVLDGLGIVDLVLEKRGATPIACEISVTTSPEHELQNAAKCLAAGFEHVFLIAPDKDTLSRVRKRAPSILTGSQIKKVRFVLPEQIFVSVSVLESRPEVTAAAPAEEAKELLTAREVEQLLRIDVKTIYNYVQRGLIPYVRIQSNLRFVKSEILAWVAEHQSGGKSPKRK